MPSSPRAILTRIDSSDRIMRRLEAGDLAGLLVGELGWEGATLGPFAVEVDGERHAVTPLAHKAGLHVLGVSIAGGLPPADLRGRVDRALAARVEERLVVFVAGHEQVWRWPERRRGGGVRPVSCAGTAVAPRLAALAFTPADDERGVALADVRERIRGDRGTVASRRFASRFARVHLDVAAAIEAVADDEERRRQASLLLSRLMAERFLGDGACADGRGAPPIGAAALARVHAFLDGFAWRLDGLPGGGPGDELARRPGARPASGPGELTPDVMARVFERSITPTAAGRRAHGAFYTDDDVAAHMAAATIAPRLLERIAARTGARHDPLLRACPRRYLREPIRHGGDPVTGAWLPVPPAVAEAWADPSRWGELDRHDPDPALLLAGETWVEALDRRERADALVAGLRRGEPATAAGLVRENLDVRTLLLDVVADLERADDVAAAWGEVTSTRVLDPACGAGAFLLAALDLFDEVYEQLALAARRVARAPGAHARRRTAGILTGPGRHGAARRAHAVRHNLHGVDLMDEAIEITRVRLALAVAAAAAPGERERALRGLDANLRAGNMLVGIRDAADGEQRLGAGAEVRALAARAGATAPDEIARAADEIHARATAPGEEPAAWARRHRPLHWLAAFPEAIAQGGFDVVIGNPPYVARSAVDYPLVGYASAAAHDVYLPCVERAATLVREGGAFAMVVPHSICFRPGAGRRVRDLLERRFGTVLASSYAKRPDALFAGVQVRTAIVVGLPSAERATCVSRHIVWPTAARSWVLDGQRYCALPDRGAAWPRVPSAAIAALLARRNGGRPPVDDGDHALFFRRTSQYWVPVLADPLPIYTAALERRPNPHLSTLRFATAERRLLALGVLAGKLGYLWWAMHGDDFNVTTETLRAAVAAFADGVRPSCELLALLRDLDAEMRSPARRMWTLNRHWVGNVDLLGLRDLTDAVDRRLLAEAGHPDGLWRDVQVWYRQAMRAGRRANNAVFAAEPPGTPAGVA